MREIACHQITETVYRLFQEAWLSIPNEVVGALKGAGEIEESPAAKDTLDRILENAEVAQTEGIPLCQDTGVAVVFLEIGQDVHVTGGDLDTAVNEGVRRGQGGGSPGKSTGP